ncbi:MAG: ABC transporter substrate-binding protein [Anaerolineae bacterium]|nr:ABC transporter substrate-binding protein [Anaerolineae bacterium]
MRSRLLALGFVFLVVLVLSISVVGAQEPSVLRILSYPDIRTADPHVAYETETWPTAALFYIGLVRWSDDNTEIVPALADEYSISDDGLVYTFHLRDGVKFSNGRDITAEDVKYSFERMFRPETASPTSYMFDAISGIAPFVDGSADAISGIAVVDDRTVTFTLDFPVWSLIQRFALPPGFIVPPEADEAAAAAGSTIDQMPLGAGPFVLDSWQSGVKITGSRNPYYYLPDRPIFDSFELEIGLEPSVGILRMEAGEADITLDFVPNSEYPRISADPVLSEQLLPTAGFPNVDYMIFNTNIEPFNNVDVRHAMNMAIDHQRLVQILNGRAVPSEGPIPPSVLGNNADLPPIPYDPDGARALLASAGYADGFTAELLTNNDPTNLSVAQALLADFSAVGITIDMIQVDDSVFVDTVINQPDSLQLVLTNWYLDYPDPSNVWEPLLSCGGSYNWGRYCNEDLEAQFAVANANPPGDARWAAFSDFEAAIAADYPWGFLVHQINYYFKSARVTVPTDPAILLRWDAAFLN